MPEHRDQSGRRSPVDRLNLRLLTNGTEVAYALLEIVRFQASNIKLKSNESHYSHSQFQPYKPPYC